MSDHASISMQMFSRLTSYLNYLKYLPPDSPDNISATKIAEGLGLNHVQVRKDLAAVSGAGKPKVGYITEGLISDIEHFLGYDDNFVAALVGVGNLGKALLSYENLEKYGLNIAVAFDCDPDLIGTEISRKMILENEKIADLCQRLKVKIGIIAVPVQAAQSVCDQLVAGGVKAIWNFAPLHLKVPEGVAIKNEDMAVSLAALINILTRNAMQ